MEITELAPKSNLKEYILFCKFLNGEKCLPNAIYWSVTINDKITIISILHEEVKSQLIKAAKEAKKFEELKVGDYKEFLILQTKYEVFLNSIYSLFESLSFILYNIYRASNLPRGFNNQKKRFLENRNINSEYSKLLETTDWYEEIHSIRSQSTHFLSGWVVFVGENELGYFNIPIGNRKGTAEKISIPSIEEHIRVVKKKFTDFIAEFGKIFVKIIDQNSRVTYPCLSSRNEIIGKLSISLQEYFKGEDWKCEGPVGCRNRKICKFSNAVRTKPET